uniref:Lipoprotein n=1 Tax=Fervidobacterium pennivorans TaxID=93466 RepID=A0A7V4KDB8_FERPE
MKRVLFVFVTVSMILILSSCAYLINNFLSGTGKQTYTFYFYVNGLPEEVLRSLQDIDTAGSLVISSIEHEATITIENPFEVSSATTNIFGDMLGKYDIATTSKENLDFSSRLKISFSTDTTLPATTVAINFPKKSYDISGANEFYVVYDFTSESSEVKFLKKVNGYLFEIRTKAREFIEVYDINSGKNYKLFSENISGTFKAFFVAERGKTYTFKAVEQGVEQTKSVPYYSDRDTEVVDLTGTSSM